MSIHTFGHKTHFSIGESIISPKSLVEEAANKGLSSIAVSDTHSINALADLTKACKSHDIKPIVGSTIDIVDDITWRKAGRKEKKTKNAFWRATLYVKNDEGLVDLMKLLSLANDEDHFYFKPQIELEELIETLKKGNLFCTTGSLYSLFSHLDSTSILSSIKDACSASDLLVELVPVNQLYFDRVNISGIKAANKFELRTIYSRPSLFKEDQSSLRDTINCIMGRNLKSSMWRQEANETLSILSDKNFVAEIKSMASRIEREIPKKDFSRLIKGSLADQEQVISEINFEWQKREPCLPSLSATPFESLRDLCIEGWKQRLSKKVLGYRPDKSVLPEYKKRLSYELGIIKKMGFSDYFLLVHKLVEWCKDEKIIVGPGRGSVGGSLIAFLTGITDVDPMRFDLIFERFINPDRIDLPDIDLDFMSSRRLEIIEYLSNEFGKEYVAGISNYSILGSSSALRSVSKAHGLKEIDYTCSKLIPSVHGKSFALEDSIEEVAEIEKFSLAHPDAWRESVSAQGVFRNYGKHAAGIVVAGEPIVNRAVLERRKNESLINWDKRTVEDFGLIKLDVLGLSTLDILSHANDYIEESTGKRVTYTDIPLDDPKVLEGFEKGNTVGVFQFESGGMRRLLKSLAESDHLTFDDITAATALYRPGPMESGLMENFVNIKQGNAEPYYMHSNMIEALEPTYSVIVYQEQVMQIARDLAGFTMIESDHLRKIMGKKLPEEMAKLRDSWVEGCINHSGISETSASNLFDQIESFAGYAFNKSHSVEYTIISYWAMWVKTYHPAAFFASTMTILDDIKIVKDAEKNGIYVVPPDINKSSDRFEIGYDKARAQQILYAPFQMIKGVSETGSLAILNAKKEIGRPFVSKQEFVDTVERRKCNIRVQNALDSVGAFASVTDTEKEQIPARHPDRIRDQKQLMPSIVTASVTADRRIVVNTFVKDELSEMIQQTLSCTNCSLSGECHPTPRLGRSPKIMIVTDCPDWAEGDRGAMGQGKASAIYIEQALKENDLNWKDVYYTSLVKSPKPKGEQLANEMINGCSDFLEQEIKLLKPPVIVALGGKVARHLNPDLKGGWEEICGDESYMPAIDTTLIVGMNPMMIGFDESKQDMLNDVFAQVSALITNN